MLRRLAFVVVPSRGFFASLVGISLVAGSVFVLAAPETPLVVKLAPAGITAQASGAPPEEVAEIAADAWDLFDRDTLPSGFRVTREARVVVDFGEALTVTEVRIRGNDAAKVSIDREDGAGGWATIPGLNSLDLTNLPGDRWTKQPAGGQVITRRLSFLFTPRNAQSTTTGLTEIEVWGPRATRHRLSLTDVGRTARAGELAYPFEAVASSRSEIAATSPAGAQTTFVLSRDARAYRRAWLVYDVLGATRGVGVKRSWNGLPVRGGYQGDPVTPGVWTEVTEEVDPSWLRAGTNVLDVRMSDDRPVHLRNLQLVAEVEDGRNDVNSIRADSGLDMLRDGDPATRWTLPASPESELLFDLDRVVEIDGFDIHVPAARQGRAVLEAWVDGAWTAVPTTGEMNTGAWTPGWNAVHVSAPVAAHSFRLRFLPTEAGLEIGEVSLRGSAVGSRWGLPRIVVRAPEQGEYWDDESYIWGWVSPTLVGGQVADVTVGGTTAPRDPDGAFARVVTRSDSTNGASGTGAWQVKVEARLANGVILTRYVDFTDDRSASTESGSDGPVATGPSGGEDTPGAGESVPADEDRRGGSGGSGAPPTRNSKKIKPAEGGEVSLGRCDVVIPPWALREETEIVIEALAEAEVPGLGPALVNLTSPHAACRFLPHGNFDKPVRIRVPYEANLLPEGISEEEVTSHYYDEQLKQWLPLKKIAVQKGTQQILSETTHFTDVIDGILVLPDHPSPLSYNPNSIKDLKAASPTAGIDFIEPPSANQSGAANLGFAIRVPPGRGGAEPSLAVRYSSGGGNGPMGLGWSLGTSSISIDTRFGVPRYDGNELYTLDGSQLVRDGSEGGEARFRERIEGSFLKILRRGSGHSNYSWEVTSKDGSRAIYGAVANSRLVDPGDDDHAGGNISQWFLQQTIDPNGNTVEYTYFQDRQTPTDGGRLAGQPWVAVYLEEVRYSGHVSEALGSGKYSVTLSYSNKVGDEDRPDLVIDGRMGFKTLWRKVLTAATVRFGSTTVRKYVFEYEAGDFQKTLLSKVTLRGRDNASDFYEHTFDYEKKPVSSAGAFAPFADPETFESLPEDAPLTLSEGESVGKNRYVGIGTASRSQAIGMRVFRERSTERVTEMLVDVNGDNRPDKIAKDKVRLNQGDSFGTPVTVADLVAGDSGDEHIELNTSRGTGTGWEAPYSVYSRNTSFSTTRARRILIDADGDGLIDALKAGKILRNATDLDSGEPAFVAGFDPTAPGALAAVDEDTRAALEARIFNVDPVIRWVAPFYGKVRIAGPVRWDGRDAVFHRDLSHFAPVEASISTGASINSGATELWKHPFSVAEQVSPLTPDGSSLTIDVAPGSVIYFRAHATGDTRSTTLHWEPTVIYEKYWLTAKSPGTTVPEFDPDVSAVDHAGRLVFVFSHPADFSLQGVGREVVGLPERGEIRIGGAIHKRKTSHPVTALIKKIRIVDGNHSPTIVELEVSPDEEVIYERTFEAEEEADVTLARALTVETLNGRPAMLLAFQLVSNGDLRDERVSWRPNVGYTTVCRATTERSSGTPSLGATPREVCESVGTPPGIGGFRRDALGEPLFSFDVVPGRTLPSAATAPPVEIRLPRTGRVEVEVTVPGTDAPNGEVLVLGVNRRHFSGILTKTEAGIASVHGKFDLDVQAGDRLFLRTETSEIASAAPAGTLRVKYETTCHLEDGVQVCEDADDGAHTPPTRTVGNQVVFVRLQREPDDSGFTGGGHGWFASGWNGKREFAPQDFDKEPPRGNNDDEEADSLRGQPYGVPFSRLVSADPATDSWGLIDSAKVEQTQLVPGRAAPEADDWFDGPDDLRVAEARSDGEAFGGEYNGISAGIGISRTKNFSRLDLFDFNGDRIPDQVAKGKVRLLSKLGLPLADGEITLETDDVRRGRGVGLTVSLGRNVSFRHESRSSGTPAPSDPAPSDRAQGLTGFVDASIVPGVSGSIGLTNSTNDWLDVNGDGLPDLVKRTPGSDDMRVQLNLGYRLGKEEQWGAGSFIEESLPVPGGLPFSYAAYKAPMERVLPTSEIGPDTLRSDITLSLTASLTGSVSAAGAYGAGGGLSFTFAGDAVLVDVLDVHGDGLPDLVFKLPGENALRVKPNVGGGFGATERWPLPSFFEGGDSIQARFQELVEDAGVEGSGNHFWPDSAPFDPFAMPDALRFSGSFSQSQNVFANIAIPIFTPIWLHLGRGYSEGKSETGLDVTFQDLDGDGLLDHLYKERHGETFLRWKRNLVGPTNLLKRVNRPLGSHFSLQYERAPNTSRNPMAQWTLAEVQLTDEFSSETYTTAFAYDRGVYDRTDREFLGFGTVITRDAVDREVEQTYDVSAYHRQGLLLETVVRGNADLVTLAAIPRHRNGTATLPVWTKSIHRYEDRAILGPATPGGAPRSVFPQRIETVTHFYEGNTTSAAGSGTKSSTERFAFDPLGNLSHYEELGEPGPADDVRADVTYASLPGYRVGLPQRLTTRNAGGQLLRERIAAYDPSGNLVTLTSTLAGASSPTSHLTWDNRGNLTSFTDPVGYRITYLYDDTVRTYVREVSDSFGYRSTATHDFVFGLPLINTDLNREKTEYRYDPFGRTTAIFGPKEFGGSVAAFAMDYHFGQRPDGGSAGQRPFAVTRNKEDLTGGGTLDTATVVDGLGRVVQVQTEAEVLTGGTKAHGAIVSGRVTYDAAGRVTSQEQPAFVAGFPNGFANATGGRATHFVFDPLDRTTRVTLPDGSITRTNYGFGEGLHRMEVIDAESRRRVSLADVRGNVTAIDEILSGSPIRTRYRYSALSELLDVTDARGNQTTIAYDSLGRRTRFTNPDRGRIDYQYDPAGNLIRLVDDNLRANGEAIEYRYEFSRLLEVVYPRSPHVLYEYGAPNAAFHRAGRIAKITDESGIEERFYGSLGELTKSAKTVRSFAGPEFSGTYSTEWTYDTFGRMREITYPDGEVLTYEYDQGGRVVSARGKKQGKTQRYLDDVAYDAFGSRVKLTLGNGVVTNYAYDPNRRWLAFLKTSTPEGEVLQELTYTFDRVGNILKLADAGVRGGVQEFSYDSLDRLKTAQGTAKLKNGHETRYHNAFDYDEIHNLVGKVQTHVLDPGPSPNETNYTLSLTYDGPKPHALSSDGEKTYQFDANGNQLGWDSIQGGQRRRITWNEENRISSIADPGPNTVEHLYDAGGQRIVKSGIYGETATVNAFFTAKNASVFTKHIFVGETRIASHVVHGGKRQITRAPATGGTLVASAGAVPAGSDGASEFAQGDGEGGDGDADPPDGPGNSENAPGHGASNAGGNGNGNANGQGSSQGAGGSNGNANGGHSNNGVDPCTRGLGKKIGLDCDGSEEPPPGGGGGGGNPGSGPGSRSGPAHRVFFYHPDHLGSSSWLSDSNGRVWERLAYFPFGEVWIDEGNLPGGPGQNFRFTGKEQDPETGLYYFGARYYDGRTQLFSAVDPDLLRTGKQLSPSSLTAFAYARWNPLSFVDPTGLAEKFFMWRWGESVSNFGTGLIDPAQNQKAMQYSGPFAPFVPVAGLAATMVGETMQFGSGTQDATGPQLDEAGSYSEWVARGGFGGIATDVIRGSVVGGGVLAVAERTAATGAARTLPAAGRIQANQARGAAFEAQVAAEMEAEGWTVAREVTLETPGGARTRMDIIGTQAGRVRCVECKSSATAPLTPGQIAAHPQIEAQGATVMGQGKPSVPGGTQIPPTRVEIRRPE